MREIGILMPMEDRETLRLVFNEDAARYDLTRPRYPSQLFDDLQRIAGLDTGSKVFEIGCGTGQATLHMAGRGWAVEAVDLGDKLAAYAAMRVRPFAHAKVTEASFDDMELRTAAYDAVAAFTSFHWMNPATRVTRAASLLRPGGTLAIVRAHHVHGDDAFFDREQECYLRWDPSTKPGFRLPDAADITPDTGEIVASRLFTDPAVHTYDADILYTTNQYIDLLRTFSHHAAMDPEHQARLFGCIAALIEELGGSVTKSYVFSMVTAARNSALITG